MIKKALLITTLFISCYSFSNEVNSPNQDYVNQIKSKIHSEWRLLKAKDGWGCKVQITQDKEGNILKSKISECNTKDKRFISQLQKAIDKSSPLPKSGQGLFDSDLTLNFKVKGDIDVIKALQDRRKRANLKEM